jgi:hypothetical protein
MIAHLDVQTVLAEIAREVERPEIAGRRMDRALEAVREFQAEKLAATARGVRGEGGGFAARQSQLNEMLLTLIAEIAATAEAASCDARHADRFVRSAIAAAASDLGEAPATPDEAIAAEAGAGAPRSRRPRRAMETSEFATDGPSGARRTPSLEEIATVEPSDFIRPQVTARRLRLPIVGPLLGRLQARIHLLSLSYAQQVAVAQESINRALAERLLDLTARSGEQEEAIEALTVQLAAARRRIAALEAGAASA